MGRKKFAGTNRILSAHARISYNPKKTLLNNNMVVIGGAGSGKTAFCVAPNLFQGYGSNVYTDPKGDMVEKYGNYLLDMGRKVKVIDLIHMEKSIRYNPFKYIRKPSDISKLLSNLIANTTPGESHPNDPFWEKAETLYLKSLFTYVWMECPRSEVVQDVDGNVKTIHLGRNFRTVLHLIDEAKVTEDEDSKLTTRMNQLALEHPLGENHPAVRTYNRCVRGADDTIRSIIVSANARFDPFGDEELLRILDDDDIDICSLGVGVNGDEKTLTSLFCIIPDDDDSLNFVPGMLYTQIFQELYLEARNYGGTLPIDVGFWFDEFANIKMPAIFDKILATCRSRGIYCTIILQSQAQLKDLYKGDRWEGIIGNCDTLLYLGGNEPSSHRYISEQLGKWTIDKRSTGESLGRNGSFSRNEDVLGRELMTPDEVRKLDNKKCICLVRGEDPIFDDKWYFFRSKEYKKAIKLGTYQDYPLIEKVGEKYITLSKKKDYTVLDEKGISYYKKKKSHGENVKIYDMSYEEFLLYDFGGENEVDYEAVKEIMKHSQDKIKKQELKLKEKKKTAQRSTSRETKTRKLIDIIIETSFTKEQEDQIQMGLVNGLSEQEVIKYANADYSPKRMSMIRELLEKQTVST